MELTAVIIIVIFCLLLEGFFSGSELALISVNRLKLKHLSESGSKAAKSVEELLDKPERLFGTTSIGTNCAMVSSTAVMTAYLVKLFGERGDIYATVIMFPVILLLGEIIPKIIFQQKADSLAIKIIWPLRFALLVFYPVVELISKITNYTLTLVAGKEGIGKHFITREELRALSMPGKDQSELDADDKKIIQKIFDFRKITVGECMVPLINLIAIEENSSANNAIRKAQESQFSRFPAFKERIYNITGILHTFDLLNHPEDEYGIKSIIRPAYYIPESKKVDDLLEELQQKGNHMAVVVDEYGAAIGIITIEDILEEIVGEIEDEFDEISSFYVKKGDDSYEIKGKMEIDAIEEELGIKFPEGDYETIAGFITDKLGRIPKVGEVLNIEGYQITIKKADLRKVILVKLKKR